MDLYLVPLRLVLTGKVKIKLRIPFCCSISKTIWRKDIWSYSSPLVDMSPLLHLTTKEKDPDPPVFSPVTDVVAKVCYIFIGTFLLFWDNGVFH